MDLEVVREQWEMQGAQPEGYADALAQVRRAVGLVAAAGRALLGDAGGSLEWLSESRAFATAPSGGKRVAFAPARGSLEITDAAGKAQQQLALDGKSVADASSWLSAQLGKPVAGGAGGGPFALGAKAALEDITRSYANAARALLCARAMAKSEEPVRVAADPLHISCSVAFGGGNGIGLGYAPGDGEIQDPYFYAKPCPVPAYDVDSLPELEGGGEWKTEGSWFGGYLRRAEWVWYDAEQLQAGATVSFLDSCVDAARALFEK